MAKLLKNLDEMDVVKFGKHQVGNETPWAIRWLVADIGNTHVTLFSESILDYRCLDAAEPNSTVSSRKTQGNNNYTVSNIDQWLNSRAVNWYTAAHTKDQSPDSSTVVTGGTEYAARPGFLYHFNDLEYNLIINGDIDCQPPSTDSSTLKTVQRRVYLPSAKELGEQHVTSWFGSSAAVYDEGTSFKIFDDDWFENWEDVAFDVEAFCEHRKGYVLNVVTNNTLANNSTSADKYCYWTRTPSYSATSYAYYIDSNGELGTSGLPNNGNIGIRPVLRLPLETPVSDTLDSDDCYRVITNDPPTEPSSISVPSSIKGGTSVTISWGTSTDPNGDTVKYSLERSVNGGSYSVIYDGTAKSYLDSITEGWSTVQYRVRAYDTNSEYSSYKTSSKITITNNTAPVISGSDSNLGTKTAGFTTTYSVTDVDNNSVTVVEAIDGKTLRSYVVTLGATNTFDVTGETWLTLTNGTHTLTINVSDGKGGTAVRTYQFVKSVYTLSVECDPMSVDTMPTRCKLAITRRVPTGATLTVMVCNNAYDSSPTWENATESVVSDGIFIFTNKNKTATSWGVAVKVTLARGDAEGSCYIKEIGGNFE